MHPHHGVPHRAFSVFLFNDRDELLVQKRAATKLLFPGHWANTVCSHPLADGSIFLGERVVGEADGEEGVRRAARRKLAHELGLDLPVDAFRLVARVLYRAQYDDEWGEHELDCILFARLGDGALPSMALHPDEVERVRWLGRDECAAFLDNASISASPWFDTIARSLLLPHWWPAMAAARRSGDGGGDGGGLLPPTESGVHDLRESPPRRGGACA